MPVRDARDFAVAVIELVALTALLELVALAAALTPVVVFVESPPPNPPTPSETGVGDTDVQTVEPEIILYGRVEVVVMLELESGLAELQALPVTGFLYQLMLGSFKQSPTSVVVYPISLKLSIMNCAKPCTVPL